MRAPSMLAANSAIKRPLDRLQSADLISAWPLLHGNSRPPVRRRAFRPPQTPPSHKVRKTQNGCLLPSLIRKRQITQTLLPNLKVSDAEYRTEKSQVKCQDLPERAHSHGSVANDKCRLAPANSSCDIESKVAAAESNRLYRLSFTDERTGALSRISYPHSLLGSEIYYRRDSFPVAK